MAADDVVSVCIPAYQAEGFIDRTLRCAREQTHEPLRILVSIDRSTDGTEEICRAHAREDDRITVMRHDEQLRWFGNVNALLDAVTTDLACIYFHDDVIDPTYCEKLAGALRSRPDAASAHCDVLLDGPEGERLRPGRTYEGTAAHRLLAYFVDPERGALLRSMVRRSSPAGRLRMSIQGADYERALVAAGPALRVAEPLYRRFVQRAGGLTDGWRALPFERIVDGLRMNATMARQLVDDVDPSPVERELLEFGLAVHLTVRLRSLGAGHGAPELVPLDDVLASPHPLELPAAAADLPSDLAELCGRALARAQAARDGT